MADAYVISKVDSATEQLGTVRKNILDLKPDAPVVMGSLDVAADP
jgi:predicted GTPase